MTPLARSTAAPVVGCFSCLTGAVTSIACTTSHGTATAHIECVDPHLSFVVDCGKPTVASTVTLHLDHQDVLAHCSVACPGGTSTFQIRGTLLEESKTAIVSFRTSFNSTRASSPFFSEFFATISSAVPNFPLTALEFPIHPPYLSPTLTLRSLHPSPSLAIHPCQHRPAMPDCSLTHGPPPFSLECRHGPHL
ncbi:hypothetical protein L596_030525 [Steinernema carpocapsae]|uniref:Phlebovirus glycoprotein G2 C-terminal domain-containing protein n=1 Tax=Steinernema carpocapsae TaxID=34508 RepID=A0A4U5LPM5_STECR|nr:hypothetical protein L596_030525 [Steinernema carpocapsae]